MRRVYPRWRGEHRRNIDSIICNPGLSPLARGTLDRVLAHLCYQRFIPAGAGNTKKRMKPGSMRSVYPRWRGEHVRPMGCGECPPGLSPLARGTRLYKWRQNCRARFIPAGAGNTRMVRPFATANAVYPRWRGEHARSSTSRVRLCGLSPLARGTHPVITL